MIQSKARTQTQAPQCGLWVSQALSYRTKPLSLATTASVQDSAHLSPIYLKILHIQDTLPRKLRLCSVNQLAEENKVRQQSLGAMPQPNPSYSVTQAQCIKEPNTNSFVRSSNEVICMGGLCQLSCADHRKGAYILLIWTQSTIALTKSQLLFRGRRRISRFQHYKKRSRMAATRTNHDNCPCSLHPILDPIHPLQKFHPLQSFFPTEHTPLICPFSFMPAAHSDYLRFQQ